MLCHSDDLEIEVWAESETYQVQVFQPPSCQTGFPKWETLINVPTMAMGFSRVLSFHESSNSTPRRINNVRNSISLFVES